MPSYTTSQALAPGVKLGSYLIQKILGANMHAFTYLAFDRELKRDVIVKENFPIEAAYRDPNNFMVLPRHPKLEAEFRTHLNRFLEQGVRLSSLDHPGIVTTQNIYEALGTAYSVLSFIPGNSLEVEAEKRHNAGTPWTANEITRILERLLNAFTYLHSKNILHRDIRPSHILLTPAGHPVLMGFDMDFSTGDEGDVTIIVAPDCASPEQILNNAAYDVKSEIYALGAAFHKLLLGTYPQRADLRFYSNRNPKLAENKELAEKFPSRLLCSIDKALEPERSDRFASAGEWLSFITSPQDSLPPYKQEEEENLPIRQKTEDPDDKPVRAKRSLVDEDDDEEEENKAPRKRQRQKRTRQRKSLMQVIKDFFLKKVDDDEY